MPPKLKGGFKLDVPMVDQKAKYYRKKVKPFCGVDTAKSWRQLLGTLSVYSGLWLTSYSCLAWSPWLSLLPSVVAGLFLVRLFMIQHDCGHGSFFKNKLLEESVGFGLGILTLTPYHYWKRTHAMHHSHSGNLDSNAEGEITTLTVEQYQSKGFWGRLGYRFYRNPLFLMTVGAIFQFAFKHRVPWDAPSRWKKEWRSVFATNATLLLLVGSTVAVIGWEAFLWVQLPITFVASVSGIFLFYVQHQYEDAYFRPRPDWDYFDAAIQGSSHLVLPKPLAWLTANIGLHHIHHLNHKIPNYKLAACFEANPDMVSGKVLTLKDTWPLLKLSLWDEDHQKMIAFADLKA